MRVVCPYTAITPATMIALDRSGYDWEPRDVSASDYAYWELLARLWADGEDFAIVEHDVYPVHGGLSSFENCPRDWCACPYPYLAGMYAGLGCVRFRSPVMARQPDLMTVVGTMSNSLHPARHWCTLDAFIQTVLQKRGEGMCTGHPEAGHPSQSPAHGCVPGYPPR